ncbi:rhodanese-like domain-containing protein [Candidatus Wolfebacteria bacterium]|nr:rhodanese-like domain-containing protein [Candidatus Wolfebacteria bacterium]
MAKVITTEELKKKIDDLLAGKAGGGDFYPIDALAPTSFAARHIPGAKNVPNGLQYAENFEKVVGAPKDLPAGRQAPEIIVYCSSSGCMASVQAAHALEEAGYTNVTHYKDGLAGWQKAGYEFEGEAAA